MDQLKHGASRLPIALGSRGLLITHVGVAKIMGAPFRAFCPGEGLGGPCVARGAGGRAGGGSRKAVRTHRTQGGRRLGRRKAWARLFELQGRRHRIARVRNPSADAPHSILPRHAPQLLGSLSSLSHLPTCPKHCGATTSSLPRWRAAQVSPQLTSQLQHRAAPSSQCAMGASFRVLRRQRRPSTSVRSRRLSAQSVKSGQRWSGGAPNQVRFGWCGSVSELVKLTPH